MLIMFVCVCLLLLDRWLWFLPTNRSIDRCDRCDCTPMCGFGSVCAYARHISPIFSARIRSLVYVLFLFFFCWKMMLYFSPLFIHLLSCSIIRWCVHPEIYMQSIDNWHIVYQSIQVCAKSTDAIQFASIWLNLTICRENWFWLLFSVRSWIWDRFFVVQPVSQYANAFDQNQRSLLSIIICMIVIISAAVVASDNDDIYNIVMRFESISTFFSLFTLHNFHYHHRWSHDFFVILVIKSERETKTRIEWKKWNIKTPIWLVELVFVCAVFCDFDFCILFCSLNVCECVWICVISFQFSTNLTTNFCLNIIETK